jgi:hypothetical protein
MSRHSFVVKHLSRPNYGADEGNRKLFTPVNVGVAALLLAPVFYSIMYGGEDKSPKRVREHASKPVPPGAYRIVPKGHYSPVTRHAPYTPEEMLEWEREEMEESYREMRRKYGEEE